MTTSESKGRFFLQNESIRIDSHDESNGIDSNRELECSNGDADRLNGDHAANVRYLWRHRTTRVANRPGFPGTVPELACGVPCPGQGRLFPGIFHKVLQYDTIRYEMLF